MTLFVLIGISPNVFYLQLIHHLLRFDILFDIFYCNWQPPIFDYMIRLCKIMVQLVISGLMSDWIKRMGFNLSGFLFCLFSFWWFFKLLSQCFIEANYSSRPTIKTLHCCKKDRIFVFYCGIFMNANWIYVIVDTE